MRKIVLLGHLFCFLSSVLFAQSSMLSTIETDSVTYMIDNGNLFTLEKGPNGELVKKGVVLNGRFWGENHTDREHYSSQEGKIIGAWVAAPFLLTLSALSVPASIEMFDYGLAYIGLPVLIAGAYFIYLAPRNIVRAKKRDRRSKDEALRHRLGLDPLPQAQISIGASSGGLGISIHF